MNLLTRRSWLYSMLINCDPFNPDNRADPARMPSIFGGVRLVSRHGVEDYVQDCQNFGLYVLAVVTAQSEGYLVPGADCYQIGNEPDIDGTADSMGPREFAQHLALYRDTYPTLPMITGGLANGDPGWLYNLQRFDGVRGYNGVAIHYPSSVTKMKDYLTAMGRTKKPLWITEWNRPADEILEWRNNYRSVGVVMDCWFTWGYEQWTLSPEQARALRA